MNFKQAVIKTVDWMLGISFVVLGVIVLFLVLNAMIGQALIVALIGWLVLCSISGLWFCLSSIESHASSIHDNLVKQTKLLEQMVNK